MHTPVETPGPPARERLGRYVLLEPLGEGGMARVYLAKKDGDSRVCVLKRLHVQLEAHPIALKRFQREAHIASMLDHPSIAHVVDAGLESERFYIAVEYIAGQTLEAIMQVAIAKWGELPIGIVLAIALDVLDGLAYAHALVDPGDGRPLKIVHRDLTPRNVMVGYQGRVSIIDFGIARGDVDEFKTAPGVLMGTPYYMSPEQARTLPVDARSDIYTFGAVLWELLTCKRLVDAKTRAQILVAVAKDPAPPPSSINPRLSRELDAVLARALAKEPEERWPDARSFRDALWEASKRTPPVSRTDLAKAMRELFPKGEADAARRLSMAGEIETFVGDRAQITRTEARSGLTPVGGPIDESAFAPTALRKTPMPEDVQSAAIPAAATASDAGAGARAGAGAGSDPVIAEPSRPMSSMTAGGFSEPGFSSRRAAIVDRRRLLALSIAGLAAAIVLGAALLISFANEDGLEVVVARDPSIPAPAPQPPAAAPALAPQVSPRAEALPPPAKVEDQPRVEVVPKPQPKRPRVEDPPPPPPKPAATSEPAPPATVQTPQPIRELRAMLAKLSAAREDANLRAQIYERFETHSAKLNAKRRARITAAIGEAMRSVEIDGFERALKQLEQAAAEGEFD